MRTQEQIDEIVRLLLAEYPQAGCTLDWGKDYELLFDGLNEARSGKRTRVRAWRVKVGALAQLALIGEEYAAMEVTGKLLKDTSITGAGLSQYFQIDLEA